MDRRPVVVHSFRGESLLHTTATANLAELIRLAAELPGRHVLNCSDPDPPTVLRIARAVAATVGHEPAEVLVPGPPPAPNVGDSPWSVPRRFVLDGRRL